MPRLLKKIPVGPFQIDVLPTEELAKELVSLSTLGGRTRHVVTANAQYYVLAEQSEQFRQCVQNAEYVCADGTSVLLACRFLAGVRIKRVPGVDLVDQVCAKAAEMNQSVYFLGGRAHSAEKSATVLQQKYPALRVAGVDCPAVGFLQDPDSLGAVVERIRVSRPNIILVALGAPRQEFFIQEIVRRLQVPIAIGVGGSFEMISGAVRRAPKWMQESGLEWMFRWYQEPRRLANRYMIGNALFSFYLGRHVMKDAWRRVLAPRHMTG